ncbi:MAG: TIGR03087 family PEP-CTERM/XrtA system glycosyltransferase [Pseudomonadota bacterium]
MPGRTGKPPLLYLTHRIPYPPNKGDKIRSWHILRHLSERFSLYLGTYVDDPDDWVHCAVLRQYCADAFFVARNPTLHRLVATSALLSGRPISVAFYQSSAMQAWVDRVVTNVGIETALLFCSPVAPFVAPGTQAGDALNRVILDLVDVDSEKFRQYAQAGTGLGRWLFRREGRLLLEHEKATSGWCGRTFLVTPEEAALYEKRAPELSGTIDHFSNGVDTDYFRPDPTFPDPYGKKMKVLVFTGAMDYAPNVEAVESFARSVFPVLRSRHPELQFWIVGGKPTKTVTDLASISGVEVTGRVADVRPYLQHALAAVAPLKIARGVQNKVLEAMAMAKPVLASANALTGIDVPSSELLEPVETPDEHLLALAPLIDGATSAPPLREGLRLWVKKRFAWDSTLAGLSATLLES